jgi:phosphomannomutase/phosphoglucomutase
MPILERTMFREYDIRGHESKEQLSEESAYHIARGFSVLLTSRGVSEVVLGSDARSTSDAFRAAAKRGFLNSGISVIDIGTVTTPMSYFAQYHLNVAGLCMVTASHNPVGWNGLKLGTGLGATLLPHDVEELYDIISREAYVNGEGKERKEDIREAYISMLVERVPLRKKLKVLLNTGNGTAGFFAPELLRRAGCEVIEHLTNVDPTYPHYTPNPDGTAMMEDTGKRTHEEDCDIGVAFDGDGDRLGITDEKGATVWPDRYLMLLARDVLERHPGAPIIFDVKVSEAVPEDISAHGGTPVMWKTGHSHIKAKRAELNAPLAGEMSGHVFFADDYYGFDDAFFACLRLLSYLGREDIPFSKLVASTPYYISTPTIQVHVTDQGKYETVKALTEEFKQEGYRVNDINGARVYTQDGWGLVRASSNTPTLVLRFEAKTEEGLERIRVLFEKKLEAHGVSKNSWDSTGH